MVGKHLFLLLFIAILHVKLKRNHNVYAYKPLRAPDKIFLSKTHGEQ